MKKSFLFAGLLAATLILPGFAKSPKLPQKDIVILYTNDVHCGVSDTIGYAGLSLYKKEMQEQTPYVSLVDAGDAVQGSTIGSISKGGYIITLMNEVGYDVAIPGNHEFDYGFDRFMEFSKSLSCGYIACNFWDKNGKLLFAPYKIISYGKTKVAYIGVCTPENITKSTPVFFQDENQNYIYSFGGEENGKVMYQAVQKAINDTRKKGADYVILVGHLGESGITEGWSAQEVAANTSGADVLIDGHSHDSTPSFTVKNKDGKDIIITQTGTKLKNIGKLTISTKGEISTELVSEVPLYNGVTKDPQIEEEIKKVNDDFASFLARKVGETSFMLRSSDDNGKWLVRKQETNLGDFITDAYKTVFQADIGMINAGGIRTNIKAGDITYGDIFAVNPFGNVACVCEVSGQTIIDELEFGVRMMGPEAKDNGGLIHVAGLTFKIKTDIPSSVETDEKNFFTGKVNGEYRVHDVLVNGESIDPDKTYTVASINYLLLQHGDGHLFKDAKRVASKETKLDRDLLCEYLELLGGKIPSDYENPNGQGRFAKD